MSRSFATRAIAAVALVALSAFLAAGCGGGGSSSSSSSATEASTTEASTTPSSGGSASTSQIGKGLTIGFVPATDCSNETVCDVGKGFKAEAEALGANAVVLENGSDPVNEAIANLDQLTSEKVDAEAFWPLDAGAMKAPTKRADAAGIPVFAHDLYETEGSGVITSVTEGRALKAKQAAEAICAKDPSGGEVLYGNFALPAPTLEYLLENFEKSLSECSNGKSKVAEVFLNKTDDVSGALPSAHAALQKNPDVVAIDNYNDPTAIGASQAATELGDRPNLLITGYNLAANGVEAIKQGRIDISWDYRPFVIGQILAKTMVEYVAKKETEPPKVIMVWPKCYTKANIEELPSSDQQLEEIAEGVELAEAEPELTQSGNSVPLPSNSLPGCPTS